MKRRVNAAWTANLPMYESSIIQVLSSIFVLFAYLILVFVSYVFITNSTPYIAVLASQHHLELVGVTLFWAAIVAWNLTLRNQSWIKLTLKRSRNNRLTRWYAILAIFGRKSRNCKNTVTSRRVMIQNRDMLGILEVMEFWLHMSYKFEEFDIQPDYLDQLFLRWPRYDI